MSKRRCRPAERLPPDDPLSAGGLAVLKRWNDEEAEWPDELANEALLPPLDPAAARVTELIAAGRAPAA